MSCTISTTYDCSIIFTGTYVLFIKSGEKIQYTHIYFQLSVCMCFHFKVFWWYFNIFNRPKCPNPKLLWPRATIHQLPFTHFFHYLPTSWCSLNSSWPSLWLWRTRLAASLILCRSSSSSSSGSIIINVHNKQKIGSKCRRSKQSSVQNILIPKMKPEWNTDIFEILNMYFSLKDSLSVIITNPNKNHCLHYLHK